MKQFIIIGFAFCLIGCKAMKQNRQQKRLDTFVVKHFMESYLKDSGGVLEDYIISEEVPNFHNQYLEIFLKDTAISNYYDASSLQDTVSKFVKINNKIIKLGTTYPSFKGESKEYEGNKINIFYSKPFYNYLTVYVIVANSSATFEKNNSAISMFLLVKIIDGKAQLYDERFLANAYE